MADIFIRLFASPKSLSDGSSSHPKLCCSVRMPSILLIFQFCEDQQKKHFCYFSGRGCPSSLVKGAETQRLRVRRDTVHCKVQTESNATSLGGFGRLGPKEDLPL